MPGDDLLSHGETPHYHRRCVVSLPSSGWDRVVPTLYGHQAKLVGDRRCRSPWNLKSFNKLCFVLASHSLAYG